MNKEYLKINQNIVHLYNNAYLLPVYDSPFWREKIIREMRDPIFGKGERKLTYMILQGWLDNEPKFAIQVIEKMIQTVGCWKDIPYLCQQLYQKSPRHDAILPLLQKMNNALLESQENYRVAKWVPREKSRFHSFYHLLAIDWNTRILRDGSRIPLNQMYKKYRQSLSMIHSREVKTTTSLHPIREKGKIEKWKNTLLVLVLEDVLFKESWLRVACRLICDNARPRAVVIKNQYAYWFHAEGKSKGEIMECLRQLKDQNGTNMNFFSPMENIFQSFIHYMVEKKVNTEETETWCWVVMANMATTMSSSWPNKIQQMFDNQWPKQFPHMIYIHTPNDQWVDIPENKRTTFFTLSRQGLTKLQWQHITKLNHDKPTRQGSPLDSTMSILNHY